MIFPREQIYSAIFATLQPALLSPTGPFRTVSRRWQDPSLISPADRPALYQVQTAELAETSQKIAGLPIRWSTKVDLVIYTSGDSSPNSIPSTELNTLLDAVENALPNLVDGLAQTLGGRVYTARIDGKCEIVENVNGSMALAIVPVEVVTSA